MHPDLVWTDLPFMLCVGEISRNCIDYVAGGQGQDKRQVLMEEL